MIEERYIRNLNAISEEDQIKLFNANVCVIGCGGLGGYIIEILARVGVGRITAADGDVFEESNLNRQILSAPELLGEKKAIVAGKRVALINPDVKLTPIAEFIDEKNAEEIIAGHDILIDALDNPGDRLIIKKACANLGMTMIHGAIGGWFGQLSVIRPEDHILEKLYEHIQDSKQPALGNPTFVPPVIAAMEVSECVKVLLGRGSSLEGKMLAIDLLENEFEIIEF